MIRSNAFRIVASGIVGAVTWWVALLLVFGPAQAILANPQRQSTKFLAAFTESPIPRMAENPEVMVWGLLIIGLIHASVYVWLHPSLVGSAWQRGLTFGLIAWALMVPWFEFYLPWNVLREPLALVLLESACWLVVLLAVGLSIASVHDFLIRRWGSADDAT